MGRDVLEHHAARPDLGTLPDFDPPQDFGARPDQDSGAHHRVPRPVFLPRAPQGHLVQD